MKLTYDLHIHSCLSPCADDDMTPENIAGMAHLNHLHVAALTDHNTCRNCEAFLKAAARYGIFGICGMELTTAEEVHAVCLFPSLERAMDFDAYVADRRLLLQNNPELFGRQLLYAPDDQPAGEYDPLLLCATDISFSALTHLLPEFGGIYFPAHIDKPSNSLLSNLGFIPYDSEFSFYELSSRCTEDRQQELLERNPRLVPCRPLWNSDAHSLGQIKEGGIPLEADDVTFASLFRTAPC
ncbi:MAG TPA: phosphoesterase [Lachnospiraceae bacterium]|nr:phosphoesterase [Lachnospiraceae bacterium]